MHSDQGHGTASAQGREQTDKLRYRHPSHQVELDAVCWRHSAVDDDGVTQGEWSVR